MGTGTFVFLVRLNAYDIPGGRKIETEKQG